MAQERSHGSDSFDLRRGSPPYALSSRSGSSEVGGHSGDSFQEASGFWYGEDEGFLVEEEFFRRGREAARSENRPFLASGSRASEIWDDWADSAPRRYGLSEACLALDSRVPEVWDDWPDGAPPSKSFAIPRASAVASARVEWGWGGSTSESDSMPIPPSSASAKVTLADGGRALDCRACFLPLKPPIFQCDRGHAVCLPCLKTLSWEGSGAADRCNVSGGHDTDGYRRNQPLEEAVKAIRVTCPNAGCGDLLTRYFLPTHRRSCKYAPKASCPNDACHFIGSAEALLDHFVSEEKWPYTAENQAGKSFDVHLRGGFNVLGAIRGTSQHLLVLHVARRPFGSALSAICIRPQCSIISWSRPPPEPLKCKLELHFLATHKPPKTSEYEVRTSFDVPCTNPSDGFPSRHHFYFQFFVPKSVLADDNAAIGVTASITIE